MAFQEVKARQGETNILALPPNLSESLSLIENKEDSPCLAQLSAGARLKGDNVCENDCYLNIDGISMNLVSMMIKGGGALIETSLPPLLYIPCSHIDVYVYI